MTIKERITKLRMLMHSHRMDAYLIPSDDFHQSEYVGDYFKARAFITGFTGSAGTAVITKDKAGLWTDGRYFIQAEKELQGSGITLYRMGEPGVPTIEEFLNNELAEQAVLGFDGRVISVANGKKYKALLESKNGSVCDAYDLIQEIWDDRPALANAPVFSYDVKYCGETVASKLSRLREKMTENQATSHLLISLDDIAWLLNIRGRDTHFTPVVLCYAFVTMNEVHLFIDKNKLSKQLESVFNNDCIIIHPYDDVYDYIANMTQDSVLIDPDRLNYALYNRIPNVVTKVETVNPTILYKSMKNEIEIENTRIAHLKDAIAHTKFMCWVKTHFAQETITELSASDKLESLRAEQENFLWPSFEPISAYGPHAAMCHYSSSEETNVTLEAGTLFLTDTGGNYLEGSTDITRTIALGEISSDLKRDFTNVLRGNLALSKAVFLYGCTGENLDILARQYLWNCNQDYKHGTGHGVGHLLSIHEGPCNIRWQHRADSCVLEKGMIISDEPGIYIENSHGIRLENELVVQEGVKNEYGQFLHFEVLTFVPFDLDAIDLSMLRQDEKDQLNAYHKQVYEMVAPHMNSDELEWLKKYTRAI